MNGYKERRFCAEIDGRPGKIKKHADFGCFNGLGMLLLEGSLDARVGTYLALDEH